METSWQILKAWRSISHGMTVNYFKVTGISNSVHGSEVDFLRHQSDEESCQEDTAESEEDQIVNQCTFI
jgi:hypothetical protein